MHGFEMKLNFFYKKTLISIFALSFSGLSFAETSPLVANMKVFSVNSSNESKKELKATDEVKPNSLLEYQVTYSNQSAKSLNSLKLNLPLPAHVTYNGKSFPMNTYASTDGIHFAKAPLTRLEKGKKVNVPLNEYRVLQWNVTELKAKQKTVISAQVRVN